MTLKKLLVCFVSIIMCLNFFPSASLFAEADGNDIRVSLTSYQSAYNALRGTNELDVEFGNVCWREGDSAVYEIEANEAGLYRIGIQISGAENYISRLTATVNGIKQLDNAAAVLHGNYMNLSDAFFGTVALEQGMNTVSIKCETGSAGAYARELFFNYTGARDIRMHVQSYTTAHNVKNSSPVLTTDGSPENTVWFIGDWAEYHIYISEPGMYDVGMKTAAGVSEALTFSFAVNNVNKLSNVTKNTLNTTPYGEKVDLSFGQISFFNTGTYTLKISKSAGGFSYADEIFLKYAGKIEVDEIRVQMGAYQEAFSNTTNTPGLIVENGFYVWRGPGATSNVGDWAKYSVEVPVAGKYKFGIKLGGAVGYLTGIRLSVNGEEKLYNNEIAIKSVYESPVDTHMGILEFTEPGVYEFMLENTLENSGVYTRDWYLTYLGDSIEFVSVKTADGVLNDGGSVSAGTDMFELEFSKNIKENDITDTEKTKICIADSTGHKLSFEGKVTKEKAYIMLTESLKEGESYTLKIGQVSDAVEYSVLTPLQYGFTAESGDGEETVCDAMVSFEDNCATITAKMVSSQNVGIKGRKYNIYIKYADGEPSKIAAGTSDSDGKIECSYTLPESSNDGEYTFIIDGDYTSESLSASAVYVSANLKENIKNALNSCGTSSEAQTVIEDNALYLGINVTTELDGIERSKVYNHFVEEKINKFEEIVENFNKYVAVEKISQAAFMQIEDVLRNEATWSAIGLNKDKYDTLTSKGAGVKVRTEIAAISDALTAMGFIQEIENVLQSNLRLQFNKTGLTPAFLNTAAYKGQVVVLPIEFEEEYTELKEVYLTLEAADASITEEAYVELSVLGKSAVSVEENVLNISIVLDKTLSGKKLGSINLVAPMSAGTYNVTAKGSVIYSPEELDFDICADVNNLSFNIVTTETPSNSQGSQSIYPSGGGGGKGGNGSGNTPVIKPETEKFVFGDMAENHWAYEAVTYLLNKNAISKTADKKFYPDKTESRGEIIKTLVIALGITDENAKSNMVDILPTDKLYKYIASAEKNGIIYGNDKGEAMANFEITREELCVILFRAVDDKLSFTKENELFADDGNISDYAKEAVYALKNMGVINGVGNNEFMPKGTVTKAQAAKMVYQIVKAVVK